MNRMPWMSAGMFLMVTAAGCRTATRVVEEPRVDLELNGTGNRGYLVGTPPPAPAMATSRAMVETEIEVPTRYQAKRGMGGPVSLGESASQGGQVNSESPVDGSSAVAMDTYVVKEGDSLSKIAHQVYGNGRKWHRIYKANQDILKTPNSLKAGMTLKIPRGSAGTASQHSVSTESGTTFSK